MDRAEAFDPAVLAACFDAGIMGIEAPEEYGGATLPLATRIGPHPGLGKYFRSMGPVVANPRGLATFLRGNPARPSNMASSPFRLSNTANMGAHLQRGTLRVRRGFLFPMRVSGSLYVSCKIEIQDPP